MHEHHRVLRMLEHAIVDHKSILQPFILVQTGESLFLNPRTVQHVTTRDDVWGELLALDT